MRYKTIGVIQAAVCLQACLPVSAPAAPTAETLAGQAATAPAEFAYSIEITYPAAQTDIPGTVYVVAPTHDYDMHGNILFAHGALTHQGTAHGFPTEAYDTYSYQGTLTADPGLNPAKV